jgi:hypothetical protein
MRFVKNLQYIFGSSEYGSIFCSIPVQLKGRVSDPDPYPDPDPH